MEEYRIMYYCLFNAVTDAIRKAENGETEEIREILIRAQQECERIYIEGLET